MLRRLLASILMLLCAAQWAGAATLLPPGEQTFFDNNGLPLEGGSVQFYIPNTTTPKNTWLDSAQVNLNTNPVILDGSGRAIIYGSGVYREVVKDLNGITIWDQLTADTSSTQLSGGGTSGGSANAQTVTAAGYTQTTFQAVSFIAGFTNTGATTLNINAFGALPILKDTAAGPVALTGNELTSGNIVTVIYDGTIGAFHLLNNVPTTQTLTNITSAATTSLASVASSNINVTGTATITSFGSGGNLSYPLYNLFFSGAATLANSSALLIPGGANLTVAAGDGALVEYMSPPSNWKVIAYWRGSSLPLVAGGQQVFTGAQNANSFSINNLPTPVNPGDAAPKSYVDTAISARGHLSTCSPATLVNAFNISSVVRNSAGSYTFNFTVAMADANYSVAAFPQSSTSADIIASGIGPSQHTTTAFTVNTAQAHTGSGVDCSGLDVIVSGN